MTRCFLLLDPNRQSAQYTADLIRYFKFDVDCVHNLDGALTRLDEHEYSALILDGRFVAKAGGRLMDWLRDRCRTISIILVFPEMCESLHEFTDIICCGMVVQILRNPFPPLALKEALNSAIRQSDTSMPAHARYPVDEPHKLDETREKDERLIGGCSSFGRANHFASLSLAGGVKIGDLRKYMI